MTQKTFDDTESVLEGPTFPPDPISNSNRIRSRSREALELYDRLEAERNEYDDPLFD